MKLKYTIGLIIICLLLVIYILVFEKQPVKEPTPGGEQEKILTFTSTELKELTLVYNEQTLHLKKIGSAWEMDVPFKSPVDTSRVTPAIDRLMDWKSTRKVLDEIKASELAEFGFQNPILTIKPTWNKTREPKEILVGKQTPTNSGYYIMPKPGVKVYLAENFIIEDLTKLVKEPPKATPTPTPMSTPLPTLTPSTTAIPTLLKPIGESVSGSPTHKHGSGTGGGRGSGGEQHTGGGRQN